MPQTPPVALIADAASPIGAAYAERLAGLGYDLLLVGGGTARLASIVGRLRGATGRRIEPVLADLDDPAEQRRVAGLLHANPRVRVLVNNLTAADATPLLSTDPYRMARGLALNVAAAARLAQAAAGAFARRGDGRIVNVTPPEVADADASGVQAATRAFVLAFSRSLHHELAGTAVRVRVVNAGARHERASTPARTRPSVAA